MRLTEAKTHFLHVKAETDVLDVDARIAECLIFKGDAEAALAAVSDGLVRARSSKGGAKVVPLLERARGHALLNVGDPAGARQALEASLAAARSRGDLSQTTLSLQSLIEAHRRAGVEPSPDVVAESESLIARLKIRALPPIPTPARSQG